MENSTLYAGTLCTDPTKHHTPKGSAYFVMFKPRGRSKRAKAGRWVDLDMPSGPTERASSWRLDGYETEEPDEQADDSEEHDEQLESDSD